MTTLGGGWTLVAASVGGTNMPKWSTAAATPCTFPSPAAPCFLGAANLNALPYKEVAWSNTAAAVHTTAPIANMQDCPAPESNAVCSNDNEYYRFNQDSATQGMGWTGCLPLEWYNNGTGYSCSTAGGPSFNLINCADVPNGPASARSSPDCNCSPFGRFNGGGGTCPGFYNIRHWRR